MTELNKTFGYEMALRSGVAVFHKTLTSRAKPLHDGIAEDLDFLFNQAGVAGATVQQTLALARMTGYLRELSHTFGVLAQFGFAFESIENPDGSKTLSIQKTPRTS